MKQIFELILDVFLLACSLLLIAMTIHVMIMAYKSGNIEVASYTGIITIVFLLFWKACRLDIKLYKIERKLRDDKNG